MSEQKDRESNISSIDQQSIGTHLNEPGMQQFNEENKLKNQNAINRIFNERQNAFVYLGFGQKIMIRLDSPRTQMIIKQEGIIHDFEPKELKEFGGPNVPHEVKKLRYEHYNKRLMQVLKEIIQLRKTKIQREIQEAVMKTGEKDVMNTTAKSGKFVSSPPIQQKKPAQASKNRDTLNQTSQSVNKLNESTSSFNSQASKMPVGLRFGLKKSLDFFKESHNNSVDQIGENFFEGKQEQMHQLDSKLQKQIKKYLQEKDFTQRHALRDFLLEEKRLYDLDTMDERQDKQIQKQKELHRLVCLKIEKKMEETKAKQEEVRYRLRMYRKEKLALEKAKQEIKNKQYRAALDAEAGQLKLKMEEQARRAKVKNQQMAQARFKAQQNEEQKLNQFQTILKEKTEISEALFSQNIQQKQQKIQSMSSMNEQAIQNCKTFYERKQINIMNNVAHKMDEKTQHFQCVKILKSKSKKESQETSEFKKLRHKENYQQVKKQKRQFMSQVKERHQKEEHGLEVQRMAEYNKRILQQEDQRLRNLEKLDNFDRTKRKNDFLLQQMLATFRGVQEKLYIKKCQKQILEITRVQSEIQKQEENNRVAELLTIAKHKLNVRRKMALEEKQMLRSMSVGPDSTEATKKKFKEHILKYQDGGLDVLSKIVNEDKLNKVRQYISLVHNTKQHQLQMEEKERIRKIKLEQEKALA